MTDNEIIKALECCYLYDVMFCDKCPNKDTCGEIDVAESAIDLIDRQKAEKEALINGQETLQKYIAEQNAEIERLTDEREKLLKECKRCGRKTQKVIVKLQKKLKTAKAEAIKEFAERLKGEAYPLTFVFNSEIDNLVKEMVGDDNGCTSVFG